IGEYMRHAMYVQGANMPLETEQVDLLAVNVTQKGRGNPNYNFEGDEPVDVELTYLIKERLDNFRIGFYIKTVFGDLLMRTLLADRNPEMEIMLPGTYCVRAQIP